MIAMSRCVKQNSLREFPKKNISVQQLACWWTWSIPSGKIWPSYQRAVYGFSDFVRPTSGRSHQLTLSCTTDVHRTLFEQSICLMSAAAKLHRKEQLRYATY